MKYYFDSKESDIFRTKKQWLADMKRQRIKSMVVFEAVRELRLGMFWCKEYQEVGEVGESCGKGWCGKYSPNNGKNGRCKHYGYLYGPGKEVILKRRKQNERKRKACLGCAINSTKK